MESQWGLNGVAGATYVHNLFAEQLRDLMHDFDAVVAHYEQEAELAVQAQERFDLANVR